MKSTKFEDIRPYFDEEIPSAMKRIAESELFPRLSSYIFPERDTEDVRTRIKNIKTISQFQHEVMYVVNEQIIKRSMTRFSCNGIRHLAPNKPYLFVSNHRDIMLDSSLLQYVLHQHGHETSEITFGANLMCHPLVIDIGKSNKMFKVERGGNMKDFYQSSLLHSEYIRHTIVEKKQSVWIAQRNGRTKDGIDHTEPGLIRMFASSMPEDRVKALAHLNIAPISISYEWETCDIAKAVELYISRTEKYVKKPGEDLNSILTGILADKGHVHIEICEPIAVEELQALASLTKQEYVKEVARLIDKRINSSYHLHPNNYIAFDIRHKSSLYEHQYSQDQKQAFLNRLKELANYDNCELDVLTDIFLGIYANPVASRFHEISAQ